MPTAMRPGNRRQASRTSPGSRTATVPRITRATPLAEPRLDGRRGADAAAELHGRGDGAEDGLDRRRVDGPAGEGAVEVDDVQVARSPGPRTARAWAAGSSLKTVASAISPRLRRTQRPSLRSMAGIQDHRGRSPVGRGCTRRPGRPSLRYLCRRTMGDVRFQSRSRRAVQAPEAIVGRPGRQASARRSRRRRHLDRALAAGAAQGPAGALRLRSRAGSTRSGRRSASPAAATRPGPVRASAIRASSTASTTAATGASRAACRTSCSRACSRAWTERRELGLTGKTGACG